MSSSQLVAMGADGAYDDKRLKQRVNSFGSTTALSADRLVIGPFDESKRKLFEDSMRFEIGNESSSSEINAMHDLAHASLFEQHRIARMLDSSSQRRPPSNGLDSVPTVRSRVTLSSKAGYIHDRIINPSMVSCLFSFAASCV